MLLVPLRLLADCSDRAAAAVAEVQAGMVVLEVQAVVALAVAAVQAAVLLLLQVRADLAAMAGPWYWSFDHAAICSC